MIDNKSRGSSYLTHGKALYIRYFRRRLFVRKSDGAEEFQEGTSWCIFFAILCCTTKNCINSLTHYLTLTHRGDPKVSPALSFYLTTILTSLLGTYISLTTVLPSTAAAIAASAFASAIASDAAVPTAMLSFARTLPFI